MVAISLLGVRRFSSCRTTSVTELQSDFSVSSRPSPPTNCAQVFNVNPDYIATAIDLFLKEFGIRLSTSPMPVGFSFPFPVERIDLNKAKIVSWGKGLRLQDGPGHNVEELLQNAFDSKKLNLRCGAIVNDVSSSAQFMTLN